MSKKYKGTGRLANIIPSYDSHTHLIVKIDVENISLLQKILECYENLAIIIPLDPKEGLLTIHTTPYLYNDVLKILDTLPKNIKIDIISPVEKSP